MSIGKNIRNIRKNLELTQDEFARKIGISKNSLWNYENNKRTPPFNTLKNISKILNINLSDILVGPETTFSFNLLEILIIVYARENHDTDSSSIGYICKDIGIENDSCFYSVINNKYDANLPDNILKKCLLLFNKLDSKEFDEFWLNNHFNASDTIKYFVIHEVLDNNQINYFITNSDLDEIEKLDYLHDSNKLAKEVNFIDSTNNFLKGLGFTIEYTQLTDNEYNVIINGVEYTEKQYNLLIESIKYNIENTNNILSGDK